MKPEELKRLEELEKAATPGPWGTKRCSGHGTLLVAGDPKPGGDYFSLQFEKAANPDFIAAARNALPALLNEIATLREEVWSFKVTTASLVRDMDSLKNENSLLRSECNYQTETTNQMTAELARLRKVKQAAEACVSYFVPVRDAVIADLKAALEASDG